MLSDDVVVVGAAVVMVVCSGPEWSPVVLEVTDIDRMGLAPSVLEAPGVMGGRTGVLGVLGVDGVPPRLPGPITFFGISFGVGGRSDGTSLAAG